MSFRSASLRPAFRPPLLRRVPLLFGLLLLGPSAPAADQVGPLIDLLVKKGIITAQEGEEVRAELALEYAETSAGKIELDEDVTHLELRTDVRVRHQTERVRDVGESETETRHRWRYRLKVGAFTHFSRGWNAGIQLETADSADSTNTDFGGYFDKDRDGVFLGQVYIDYEQAHDWADLVNLTFGKKDHPFLIDGAFWDSDTNPEGFTQQLGWRQAGDNWFYLRAGQYLIDEAREDRGEDAKDDWLFVLQTEYRQRLGRESDLRIAPYFLLESGGETSAETAEGGNVPTNENAINTFRDLAVIALPVQGSFLFHDVPQSFRATVGYNLRADDALNRPGSPYRPEGITPGADLSDEGLFFNFGYRYGRARHFKDWELGIEFRYLQAASTTPNLSDSDFGKNSLNQQGWILHGAYMLSESVRVGAAWFSSEAIEEEWSSEAAERDNVDLLQFDLQAKF